MAKKSLSLPPQMVRIDNNKCRLWGACLLILFAGYWASINLFSHGHQVDGDVIVHSHFYSGTPESPNHNHSQQNFSVISALSMWNALILLGISIPTIAVFIKERIFTQRTISIQKVALSYKTLRAPPALL